MAGKFSIYLKDDELKRKIELLARYDDTSITQMIGGILQAYVDERADDVAYCEEQEANKQARKRQQAQAPASAPADDEQEETQPEAPKPSGNLNWNY